MIIGCSRNPTLLLARSRTRMSRTRYRVDPFFRIPRTWTGRRQFEASCGAYWCSPFWIMSLQRTAGHQESQLHGRCLRHAISSFSLASLFLSFSFFLSLSLSTSCPANLWCFFFSFYSVSHSRIRRLTYLAADQTGVHVRFLTVPDFNLIFDETESHSIRLIFISLSWNLFYHAILL